MIKVNVLSEENSWAKKITKSEELFNKVCKNFPKKKTLNLTTKKYI